MADQTSTVERKLVSTVVIVSFVGIVAELLLRPVDIGPNITSVLNITLGILAAKVGTIVDFHYGSSAGSRMKDEALARRDEEHQP